MQTLTTASTIETMNALRMHRFFAAVIRHDAATPDRLVDRLLVDWLRVFDDSTA